MSTTDDLLGGRVELATVEVKVYIGDTLTHSAVESGPNQAPWSLQDLLFEAARKAEGQIVDAAELAEVVEAANNG